MNVNDVSAVPTFPFRMEKLPVGEVGEPRPAQTATGRLTIQVQPANATVLIDGQPWPASQGQNTVILDLPEGRTVNVALRTQP